mgnify:CR=1 FL=1
MPSLADVFTTAFLVKFPKKITAKGQLIKFIFKNKTTENNTLNAQDTFYLISLSDQ